MAKVPNPPFEPEAVDLGYLALYAEEWHVSFKPRPEQVSGGSRIERPSKTIEPRTILEVANAGEAVDDRQLQREPAAEPIRIFVEPSD